MNGDGWTVLFHQKFFLELNLGHGRLRTHLAKIEAEGAPLRYQSSPPVKS
jgi:hypothetical protein